jgi:hypothetical protein
MPFIRADDDGFEVDGDDNVTYTGSFGYYPPAEVAYKPRPFDPATLPPVAAAAYLMLRDAGVVQFRVRYDGGHDEGFAHADCGRTADGVVCSIDKLVADLSTPDRIDELQAAFGATASAAYYTQLAPGELPRHALDGLADEAVGCLLGQGYGTGEYSMYGAVVIDLTTGRLIDEPSAPRPPDVTFD